MTFSYFDIEGLSDPFGSHIMTLFLELSGGGFSPVLDLGWPIHSMRDPVTGYHRKDFSYNRIAAMPTDKYTRLEHKPLFNSDS